MKFEIISGEVVLSDPCYDTDTWCMGIVDNVAKGTWEASVLEYDDGRIARLAAVKTGTKNVSYLLEGYVGGLEKLPFTFGVDSGQFGFFDKQFYRDDNSVAGLKRESRQILCEDEPFYSFCCDRTMTYEQWGTLPYGVVSSSGYGDGSYDVFGLKNENGEYIAFMAIFIDIDFEDDEDEYDEEDEY